MYFACIGKEVKPKRSFAVMVSLRRNGLSSGSHSSLYSAETLSKAIDLIFSEFKLFRGEQIEKIRIKVSY